MFGVSSTQFFSIAVISKRRHFGNQLLTLVLAETPQASSAGDIVALENCRRLGLAYAWPAFHKSLHADVFHDIAAAGKHLARIDFTFLDAMKDSAPLLASRNRSCQVLAPLLWRDLRQA